MIRDMDAINRRIYLQEESRWLEYPEESEPVERDEDFEYESWRDMQLERGFE